MRAIVHRPGETHGLAFAEVPQPEAAPHQALITTQHIALNFGELKYVAEMRKPGEVPGWDASGIVTRAAADGSGPQVGARVVGFGGSGAWAQVRAVDTRELAVVPQAVELGEASTLSVAGVTALRALRALGPVVGRRVLITGASGGVGRFGVQLAARAGAHVIAAVGSEARAAGLRELGAGEVVVGLEKVREPVFGVLETVGGALLSQALTLVGRDGSLQSIGAASGKSSTVDFEGERRRAGGRSIGIFYVGNEFGADLTYLLTLLERKQLDPQVGWRGSWDRVSEAASALLERRVAGKAVLDVA